MRTLTERSAASIRKLILPALVAAICLSGCDFKYWWSRGQTKSPEQLFDYAGAKLTTARETFGEKRPEIRIMADAVETHLKLALESAGTTPAAPELGQLFETLTNDFIALGSKVSIGSRAAYGELAGQLRSFSKQLSAEKSVDAKSFELFAARTLSFLASELSVPAPAV